MKALVLICTLVAIQLATSTIIGNEPQPFSMQNWIGQKGKSIDMTTMQDQAAGKLSDSEIGKQIVGGAPATRGQFPWQAYIYIEPMMGYCGGSLIDSKWVLTAAHCTHTYTSFNVTFGTTSWLFVHSDALTVRTTEHYEHPNYTRQSLQNDVALLRLPVSVTYSAYISPIKLPSLSDPPNTYVGVLATVSGFGNINTGVANQYLNYAEVTIISNEKCARYYSHTYVFNSTICTMQESKAICQGDSGGPLAVKGRDGTWLLVGVTSFTSNQGCLYGPSGFARVSEFIPWISSIIGPAIIPTTSAVVTTPTSTPTVATTRTSTSGVATTSTRPTVITTTTKSPVTKKTLPPKCEKADFSTLHTCCLTARNDLVDKRDPSCPTPNAYKAFNSYTVNKHQNPKINFTINFSDIKVRKALGRDACLVGCYMNQHFMVFGQYFYEDDILEFLKKKNPSDPWKTRLSNAFSMCLQYVRTNSIPPFLEGKFSCDGAPLVLMQCILMKSVGTCDRNMNTKCAPRWVEYDKCKNQIFNL